MTYTRLVKHQSGFTIPELLVAIACLALMGLGSFLLLRTDTKEAVRNNAQRQTDIALIAQVLNEYQHENGTLPDSIATTEKLIGSEDGQSNLCKDLVPSFLTDLPFDPLSGAIALDEPCDATDQHYITGYAVTRSADGKSVTVRAPAAQDGSVISITRKY